MSYKHAAVFLVFIVFFLFFWQYFLYVRLTRLIYSSCFKVQYLYYINAQEKYEEKFKKQIEKKDSVVNQRERDLYAKTI